MRFSMSCDAFNASVRLNQYQIIVLIMVKQVCNSGLFLQIYKKMLFESIEELIL